MMGALTSQRQFPFDQASPLIPGPCSYSPTWDAYSCLPNSDAFDISVLPASLKPAPTPAKGIFGDPQHFVLESRDSDSEDRNVSCQLVRNLWQFACASLHLVLTDVILSSLSSLIYLHLLYLTFSSFSDGLQISPVFFNVSGSVDVAVSAMDHGWCFAYTCQKRLSTFWTYLPCE